MGSTASSSATRSGKDEIDIYVTIDSGSEVFLSGPHFLDTSNNDDFVDLHQHRTFTDVIKERNGDRGGNNDKDLGLKVFENTEPTDGGAERSPGEKRITLHMLARTAAQPARELSAARHRARVP